MKKPEFAITAEPSLLDSIKGKRVLLKHRYQGKFYVTDGVFMVEEVQTKHYVSVECEHLRYPDDPPSAAGKRFYLLQQHIDSITAANAPDSGVEYGIREPFVVS